MFTITFYSQNKAIDWTGPFASGLEAEAYADNIRNTSDHIDGWSIERI